jgi:agmatinase
MFSNVARVKPFLGATRGYAEAGVVLVGAGLDATVCFRSGTGEGPRAVRYYSECIEEYSLRLDRDLREAAYCDLGDIVLTAADIAAALSRINATAAEILADGKVPGFIGGEHLITGAVLAAVNRFFPDVVVLHFDAHADLRDKYLGESLSHATVMRRVVEMLGPGRVYQFGIRSADREEIEYARENTRLFLYGVREPYSALRQEIDKPVYITIDIDVVDPGYAPGVGTPEAGGITPRELLETVYGFAGLNVVGFDIVEVNPVCDPGGLTPLLAATVLREMILLVAG